MSSSASRTKLVAGWLLVGLLAVLAVGLARRGEAQPGAMPSARPRPIGPEVVLTIPWGLGGAALARLDAQEGASEGPMSFAVHPNGELSVLDQVARRIARFDASGRLRAEIALPAATFQELEVAADGRIVVLDRLARASLLVLSSDGHALRELGVVGEGIPEGGGITAMLARRDGIWLEFDHTNRVRLLDERLEPTVRSVVRGRGYDESAHLLGAIDRQGGAALWLEDAVSGNVRRRADLQIGHAIDRLIWAEADRNGNVHAMVHWMDWDSAEPTRLLAEGVVGLRFDSALREVARYDSPHVIVELEQFREFRLLADGTIYQMAFGPTGVTFLRWRWLP